MTRTLAVWTLSVLAVGVSGPACPADAVAPPPAHLHGYVRDWLGHTHDLRVEHGHTATEQISSGCCEAVVTVHLALSHVRGTTARGSERARVTGVTHVDPSFFDARHPAPVVGQTARLRLRHGVLHEPLTGTTYCGPGAPRGRCGA